MINVGLISLRLPSILRFRRVKKSRKRGSIQRRRSDKVHEELFPLGVPWILRLLRAGKRRNHSAKLTIIVKKTVY